jgi:hypothetical protein
MSRHVTPIGVDLPLHDLEIAFCREGGLRPKQGADGADRGPCVVLKSLNAPCMQRSGDRTFLKQLSHVTVQ